MTFIFDDRKKGEPIRNANRLSFLYPHIASVIPNKARNLPEAFARLGGVISSFTERLFISYFI